MRPSRRRCPRRCRVERRAGRPGRFYYFCLGRQRHTCDLPYLPVALVETAVLAEYATIALPAELRTRIADRMSDAMTASAGTDAELRRHVTKQFAKLNATEDQYLDLVGNPDWPQEKIAARLRKIRDERARLDRQIDHSSTPALDTARETLTLLLDLLTDPQELYRRANRRARTVLNRAFFTKIYLDGNDDGPYAASHELTPIVAPLVEVAHHPAPDGTSMPTSPENDEGGTTQPGRTADLLRAALLGGCSSTTKMVGRRYHHANPPATIAGDALPLRLRRSAR